MIIISQLKLIIFIFIIFTIFIIRHILIKNDYWYRICYSAVNKDYYKWILSDKDKNHPSLKDAILFDFKTNLYD